MRTPKVENQVVKTNRLIEAIQVLNLAEIRLIQLAIVEARESGLGLEKDTPLRIHGSRYAEIFNVNRGTAYEALKDAEAKLFDRRFSIIDDDGEVIKSRWVQDVKYLPRENAIEISLSRIVVRETTRLDGLKQFFTSYTLEQTAQLKSAYSVRLYEMLAQWVTAKKTPVLDIEKFRQQLGIGVNEYTRMHQFKERVLENALAEINEKTDLTIKYEQVKSGRNITGFSFKISKKQKKLTNVNEERDQNTGDIFVELSDAQRSMFGAKLARDPRIQSDYAQNLPSENYEIFGKAIADILLDEMHFKTLYPILVEYGYQPPKCQK